MPTKFSKLPPFERLNELLIYNPEDGRLRWRTRRPGTRSDGIAGYIKTSKDGRREWKIKIDGKMYYSSRIIWALYYHIDPGILTIDHVDQNPLNNRITNLRLATAHEQNLNMSTTSPSTAARYLGLSMHSYKNGSRRPQWYGQIRISGHHYCLGSVTVDSINDNPPDWLIARASRLYSMRDDPAITDEDLIREIGIIKTSEDSCFR